MAEDYDTEDYSDEDANPQKPPRWRKDLEERAKAGDAALKRAEEAERKLAFAEAGVKIGDKKASVFMRGYDGELTPDAIRAEATEFGLIDGSTPAPDAPADDGAVAQATAMAAASGTGPPVAQDAVSEFKRIVTEEGWDAAYGYLESQGIEVSLFQ